MRYTLDSAVELSICIGSWLGFSVTVRVRARTREWNSYGFVLLSWLGLSVSDVSMLFSYDHVMLHHFLSWLETTSSVLGALEAPEVLPYWYPLCSLCLTSF